MTAGDSPKRGWVQTLSERTPVTIGLLIVLLGGAYSFGALSSAWELKWNERIHADERTMQRIADLRSQMAAWVREYRASLPADQRANVPEFR